MFLIKLALILVVSSMVMADHKFEFKDDKTAAFNGTKCIFNPEEKIITCKNPNGMFECDAFSNFTALGMKKFYVFGIGKLPENFNYENMEKVKYLLYPREFENSTYYSSSMPFQDGFVDLFLYYSPNFSDYGIRVPNLKCYERLVDSFRFTKEDHVVKLVNFDKEVSLFGEVISFDKVALKKWLFGWPMSYGWPMSFGYPFTWGSFFWGK